MPKLLKLGVYAAVCWTKVLRDLLQLLLVVAAFLVAITTQAQKNSHVVYVTVGTTMTGWHELHIQHTANQSILNSEYLTIVPGTIVSFENKLATTATTNFNQHEAQRHFKTLQKAVTKGREAGSASFITAPLNNNTNRLSGHLQGETGYAPSESFQPSPKTSLAVQQGDCKPWLLAQLSVAVPNSTCSQLTLQQKYHRYFNLPPPIV